MSSPLSSGLEGVRHHLGEPIDELEAVCPELLAKCDLIHGEDVGSSVAGSGGER